MLPLCRDHFKAVHRPLQCERCYASFGDLKELRAHRQSVGCEREPDDMKERIDDSQMDEIEQLLRVRRGLSSREKEQHDTENWFSIRAILFPDTAKPDHPCRWPVTVAG